MNDSIRLTQYSHAAGCGCKIAPAVLQQILQTDRPGFTIPQLLVGNSTNDDAAVYDLGNGTALVSTTDFFAPIVDDAFDFGRIAAANAISDVYAMGGKPLLAVAVLGWPVEKLPASLAQQVLEGARSVCNEAQIPLAGGHSIDAPEPFFGLAVNGLVPLEQLKQNNQAQEGDWLLLTKPIGVGVLATAEKRNLLLPEHQGLALQYMSQLNRLGEELGKQPGVTAMTDVTGFGLLGHLLEMAEGAALGAELYYRHIPLLDAARHYLAQRVVPDATYRNWNSYSSKVGFEAGVNVMEAFNLLPDPQTNGGLLIAVAPAHLETIQQVFRQHGLEAFTEPVGRFTPSIGDKVVRVLP